MSATTAAFAESSHSGAIDNARQTSAPTELKGRDLGTGNEVPKILLPTLSCIQNPGPVAKCDINALLPKRGAKPN